MWASIPTLAPCPSLSGRGLLSWLPPPSSPTQGVTFVSSLVWLPVGTGWLSAVEVEVIYSVLVYNPEEGARGQALPVITLG